MTFPFTGIPTFLRSPLHTELTTLDADIAVLGIPTDEGSPFMPGSRFGPRALREHSLRFVGDEPGYYDANRRERYLADEMSRRRIVDVGDVDVLPTNVERTFENVTTLVASVLRAGAMPVVLGGDHAITYPVVRAFAGPLHVIHFDAHMDYAPFVHGLSLTNSHAFRHIAHMEHVASLTQVGIRSLRTTRAMLEDSIGDGNRVITMQELRLAGPSEVLGKVPREAACYVSIDIDVLDMALVPGCVSAEPDGLTYGGLRDILDSIATHCRVVGFDVVEVNPLLDVATGVTSYLAAHMTIEFLGRICAQPRWRQRPQLSASVTSRPKA